MSRIIEYMIIEGCDGTVSDFNGHEIRRFTSIQNLQEQCARLMNEGWQPLGGAANKENTNILMQTLVKYEQELKMSEEVKVFYGDANSQPGMSVEQEMLIVLKEIRDGMAELMKCLNAEYLSSGLIKHYVTTKSLYGDLR